MIVNRILFVYLKIRLRLLIRFGGVGSLELDMYIKIVQLYKINYISMFDSQIYFYEAGGKIKLEREDIVCQRILFADEYCFPSCRHSHISPFCPHENISDSCPAHILHSVHTEVLPPTFFPEDILNCVHLYLLTLKSNYKICLWRYISTTVDSYKILLFVRDH